MNFLELYKKIQNIDEGLSQGNMSVQAIGAAPSSPELTSEDEMCDECGDMHPMDQHKTLQQDNVSMNVTMSGSGKGGIRDLMDVLKNIEQHADSDHGVEVPMMGDEYANEPAPEESEIDAMMVSGNDLHSKGLEAPKQAGGGNPWNVSESVIAAKLANHYNEVKSRSAVSEGYHGWDDPRADEPEDDYGYGSGTTEMDLPAPYDIDVNDEDYNVRTGDEVIFMVDYSADGEHYEVERVYYGGFDNIPEIEIDWNKTPREWNNMVHDRVGEWLLRQKKQTSYVSPRRPRQQVDHDYDDPETSFNAMTDYEKRINRDY